MIFVTVGTNEARFDRLLQAVADLRTDEEIVVQHGHSTRTAPPGAKLVDFLPFDAMTETMRQARLVVTHAGVGSVLVSLANGQRPVVVPRRKRYREAVDDHQLQLGRRFAAAGLVTLVEAPEDALAEALALGRRTAAVVPSASALCADLGRFLDETIPGALAPPAAA